MSSCRPREGGSPKCPLGILCQQSSVEIRGKSLDSIIQSQKARRSLVSPTELQREYDLFIVLGNPGYFDYRSNNIGFDDQFKRLIDFVRKSGFDPKKVFVTYIVKCFNKDRKPSVQEINICKEYIHKELKNINPKVVMLLGRTPLRLFNLHNRGGINKIRGQVFDLPIPKLKEEKTYKIVPSLDPGFFDFSSDPKLELKVLEDYRTSAILIQGMIPKKKTLAPDYKLISSLDELDELIEETIKKKIFVFDTESRSLPWTKEPLICCSLTLDYDNYYSNYILPIYQHDPNGVDWKLKKFWSDHDLEIVKKKLKDIFENPQISKGGHNIKYDVNVVWKHLGLDTKGFFWDSMLLHHALQEQRPHDLKYLSDLEFGTGNYDKELEEYIGDGSTYDNIPDKVFWKYAAQDAYNTSRLLKRYIGQCSSDILKLYKKEIEPLIHTLVDSERQGHPIDQVALSDLIDDYKETGDKLLEQIRKLTFSGFNPSSTNHVRSALIQMGFESDIRDPKKASGYTTDKNKLLELRDRGVKLPGLVLKYRDTIKIAGTYLGRIQKNLDSDGRLRPNFLIHGTESARLSCTLFHQMPRPDPERVKNGKKVVRDLFISSEGCSIVYADYSQIELRILAVLSKDREMLRLFREGKDIHVATAATLLDIPEDKINKHNRQLGKNTNFAISYGSEGYRLLQTNTWMDEKGIEHPLTPEKFERGFRSFKERFIGLSSYLESIPIITRQNGGEFVTPFGRHRRLGNKIFNKRFRKAAEREVVNFSIQSPAAAVTFRTMNIIHNYITQWREAGLDPEELWLLNTVHDSMAYNVRDDRVEWFSGILKNVAERPIQELDNYQFPSNIGVGKVLTLAE